MAPSSSALGYQGSFEFQRYAISVNVGDELGITLALPGAGPGEFVNDANTRVLLYDENNALMADGTGVFGHTALTSGLYTLVVETSSGLGNYLVNVTGATGSPVGFNVNYTLLMMAPELAY